MRLPPCLGKGEQDVALRNGRRGMTLLELLIAAALVAVAALVVAQAFAAGFRVWSRASRLGGNYADSVLAMESLQQDLRNTVPCRKAAFCGEGVWVEIPSLINQAGKDETGRQPGLVRYQYDVAGKKLDRVTTAYDLTMPDVLRRETVAGGIKSLTFLFAERAGASAELVWGRAWEGRTNNPVAVKVMWTAQQGEDTFEFERTVALPVR